MKEKDDVTIVGAGLGGLVAGALLAKRGLKVTVLEQHYAVGGCATIFHRKGFKFDVALRAIDGLDAFDAKMDAFKELDVLQRVPFIHLDRREFYRVKHPGGFDVTVPANAELAVEELGRKFPREKKRLREFFKTILTIRRELNETYRLYGFSLFARIASFPLRCATTFRHRNDNIGDFLDASFDDEALKLSLIANLLYYHDDARKMSLIWYALAQGSYFAGGTHYIKGGGKVLADHFAKCIEERGGQVLLSNKVEEIVVEGGRATGVKYRRSRGSRQDIELERDSDLVIANAALPIVVNELVRGDALNGYREKVRSMRPSCSFLCLWIAHERPLSALGHDAYTTITLGEHTKTIDDLTRENQSSKIAEKGFEFVDYGQIDSGLAPAGKAVSTVALVDYLSNWEGLSDAEYAEKKRETTELLLDKVERLIPGAKKEIVLSDLGTPKTIVRYTSNPSGAVYGFSADFDQAAIHRPRHGSPINNLFLASAWVMPGGGFTGAILSGMRCARLAGDKIAKRKP